MSTEKRLVLYSPHEMQLKFHKSDKRYRVAAFGRQSGKSTACLNELARRAWENPGQTFWFLSPTYDQAKGQYRRLVGMLWSCGEVLLKKNQSELRLKFINQSQIIFKSGESLDNLRGSTLHGVVIDEVRDQHPDLFSMVIRPMLATTKGWAAFVSTPNGFDQFYDLFSYGKNNPTDWDVFQAPSTCNPLITEAELLDAKRTMSEPQFAQEYMAEFRDLTQGKAYINFTEANCRLTSPFTDVGLVHHSLPIGIGMDFNVGNMAWTLSQKRVDDFYTFDEIYIQGTHTQEAANVLVEKLVECHPKIHKVGVILGGDATGSANRTSAGGQTDYDIICRTLDEAKIPWTQVTGEANPLVKDRVNNANAKLKDATGTVHWWIHPTNCPHLKKDLERVVWKMGAGKALLDQKTNPDLTHSSDGVTYLLWWQSPLVYNSAVPALKVIYR